MIHIKNKTCIVTQSFYNLPQNYEKDGTIYHQNNNLFKTLGKIIKRKFEIQMYLD